MFLSLGDAHHFINIIVVDILHGDDTLAPGFFSRLSDIDRIENDARIGAAEIQNRLIEVTVSVCRNIGSGARRVGVRAP